jgi:hypothetical protein
VVVRESDAGSKAQARGFESLKKLPRTGDAAKSGYGTVDSGNIDTAM